MAEDEIWRPKTGLGRKVLTGEITDIDTVLHGKYKVREPEIIDQLVDDLRDEVILIGGTPGKGGGKRRIVSRRTARMHKSGRRFKTKAMVVVGDGHGLIGLGEAYSQDTRDAIHKARDNAKLNLIDVKHGCGSWECGCGEPHSIPFRVTGKSGSVEVELLPAPRGVGRAVSEEVEKAMNLAGIDDIWIRSRGSTRTRENHMKAVFNALQQVNAMQTDAAVEQTVGLDGDA